MSPVAGLLMAKLLLFAIVDVFVMLTRPILKNPDGLAHLTMQAIPQHQSIMYMLPMTHPRRLHSLVPAILSTFPPMTPPTSSAV